VNKDYLRYICSEHNKSFEDLARAIGVNLSTFYRKLSGESDFSRNEIQIIRDQLHLSSEDVDKIFFTPALTKT